MEENSQKNIVNHYEAGSNCQVFNGNITGCVFAMPGSTVTQNSPNSLGTVPNEFNPDDRLRANSLGTVPSESVVKQALSKCGPYIWGNAAYTVAFCVCRDEYGWQDNASYFERQMEQQGIPLPQGTINATMSRNPYMKLKTDKWDKNGAMERVLKLRNEFRLQMARVCGQEDKSL